MDVYEINRKLRLRRRKVLGEDHPDTQRAIQWLEQMEKQQQQEEEEEEEETMYDRMRKRRRFR